MDNILELRLRNKSAVIGVIGLGYVGLPLAVTFAEAGFRVVGFDRDADKVAKVQRGESHTVDIDSPRLLKAVNTKLEATKFLSDLEAVDVAIICVPTPFTAAKTPDLSYVVSVGQSIAHYASNLSPILVVLESTTYPGSTRSDLLPILSAERKLDHDFYLAFSPEMIDPGNKTYGTANIPKIMGGVSEQSTWLAKLLYSQICSSVVEVSSPEVAEMVKVFTNTFRNVNIALVNELAMLCERMGISVWEVIDTAAKKPFGFMPFYPGLVGGFCLPKDPYYLSYKAMELGFHTRFIELATSINEQMPERVVWSIIHTLSTQGKALSASNILVLGAAFKKDIADTRDSGAIKLIEMLEKLGAKVEYNDPYVPEIVVGGTAKKSVKMDGRLSTVDCVVLAVDHSVYDIETIVAQSKLVYDIRGATRNVLKSHKHNHVFLLGEAIP